METLDSYLNHIKVFFDFRKEPKRTANLLVQMKTGDLKAREEATKELVQSTLNLVQQLAHLHCARFNTWQYQLDLIQEASAEIIKSINAYNPNRSSFETFIKRKAHYAFVAFWYNVQFIYTTGHGRRMKKLVRQAEHELRAKLGRDPTLEELADYLDKDQSKISSIQMHSATSVTDVNEPLYNDEDNSIRLLDILESPGKSPYQMAESSEIKRICIEALGKKDAHLLVVYHDEGVEAFQAWYYIYYHKHVTEINARQKATRFRKKLKNYIQRQGRIKGKGDSL